MVRFLVCSLPLVSLVALACISAAIIPGHLSPDSSDTVAHEVDSAVVVDSAVLESVPLTIEGNSSARTHIRNDNH